MGDWIDRKQNKWKRWYGHKKNPTPKGNMWWKLLLFPEISPMIQNAIKLQCCALAVARSNDISQVLIRDPERRQI